MQKSIVYLCALALFIEAVMSAPRAFDLQAFEDTDNTANLAAALDDADMALIRVRRGKNSCFSECFACTLMVSKINPTICVSECQAQGKAIKGQAAKEWTICFMALQRRK